MDFSHNFSATRDLITAGLIGTTRSSARIAAEDVGFHRSSNPMIGLALDEQNGRLLSLAGKLLRCSTDGVLPLLDEVDDIEVHWRSIVDVVDSLLEKVDTCLDEFTGLVKRMTPTDGAQSPIPKPRSRRLPLSLRNQDMPKPQLLFETPPANHEQEIFRPFLTSKPHPVVPLDQSRNIRVNEHGMKQFQHPYQLEIEEYQYPSSVYTKGDPIPYKPFESTEAIFVDTLEGVMEMLERLRDANEIAIDLEHHDTHSYIGLVSLMQISTRDQDWIVDTLRPWRRKLEVLNEVFADPRIVKVFHGAHMDIMWLQRDLGLYIVGLFDTHHASRVLGYTGGSLAFLLKKFIDFDAQKQYQTADWRTRPLPSEMFDYARSDTHFLLYIYDNMRNELVERSNFDDPEQDRVQAVLDRSKETALQRYEHAFYDEREGQGSTGWFQLLNRNSARLSEQQLAVFKKVHQWRDTLARKLDESLNHIMPNHVILSIAGTVPSDLTALLGVLHPISPEVREHTEDLLNVVMSAKAVAVQEIDSSIGVSISTTSTQAQNSLVDAQQQRQQRPGFRSRTSSFWGPILPATGKTHKQTLPSYDDYNYSMPSGPYQVEVRPIVDAAHVNTPRENDAFVVQDFDGARKRKRGEAAEATHPMSPGVVNQDSDAVIAPQSLELEDEVVRRVRRKAEKAAAKQQRKAGRVDLGSEPLNTAQFDYENAPSVLNPDKVKADKRSSKPAFNPYAKAQDGPAGLRRAQNHRVGKSATFKQ